MQHKFEVNQRLIDAINSWQEWAIDLSSKPSVIFQLGAGTTNQSFLISYEGAQMVLRLDREDACLLGVNRLNETIIWRAAATKGISPKILHQDTQKGILVYQYVEGRNWTKQDFEDASQLARLKDRIAEYQTIQLDIEPRNYEHYLFHYWEQAEEQNLADKELRQSWLDFLPKLSTFQNSSWEPCLSHHDLIPENIIDSSEGLIILDWEYAALGHPDLDWVWVTQDQNSDVSEIIFWINKLWNLLAN